MDYGLNDFLRYIIFHREKSNIIVHIMITRFTIGFLRQKGHKLFRYIDGNESGVTNFF